MQNPFGDAQLAVLEDVAFFRFLTCKQLARLRHPKSLSYAQEKLRALERAKYLRREPLDRPRTNPGAKTEDVYALAAKGVHVLAAAGVPARTEPQREHSYLFLRHTLGVNDVFLAALCVARDGVLSVEGQVHEKGIKEHPLYVQDGGHKLAVTPDGYLQLVYGPETYHVVLEYDRGTEEDGAVWKEKIRRMVLLHTQYLVPKFRGSVIVMATAVVPRDGKSERRLETLLRWTGEELLRLGRMDLVDLFHFSALDPWAEPENRQAAHDYWLAAHWQVPGRPERFPILEPLS